MPRPSACPPWATSLRSEGAPPARLAARGTGGEERRRGADGRGCGGRGAGGARSEAAGRRGLAGGRLAREAARRPGAGGRLPRARGAAAAGRDAGEGPRRGGGGAATGPRAEAWRRLAEPPRARWEGAAEADAGVATRGARRGQGLGRGGRLARGRASVLRRALAVLRRTPYLPPPLRVAAQEAEATVGAKDQRPWARIALLDRDSAGLEPLAAELEAEGLDVKIASHPEELALLLKTPEGRELDAAICDVLAFRPDQTVAGIFRGWEKDRPGLALYLSFSRDSPPEVERAQRVPLSLTKGRFQRPLNRLELMEMLEPLRRRTS